MRRYMGQGEVVTFIAWTSNSEAGAKNHSFTVGVVIKGLHFDDHDGSIHSVLNVYLKGKVRVIRNQILGIKMQPYLLALLEHYYAKFRKLPFPPEKCSPFGGTLRKGTYPRIKRIGTI